MSNNGRHSGVVKFFNSQKGYGFIIPFDGKPVNPNGRAEIFVHHSAIQNEGGFKSLAENEQVEYSLVQGPKGIQAANVTGPNGAPVQGDPMVGRMFYHQDANFSHPYNPNFPPFNQMAYPGMPPFYPPPQQFAAGASFMMSPKQPFNTFEDENAGSSTNYSHASGGPRMKGPSNGTADEKN